MKTFAKQARDAIAQGDFGRVLNITDTGLADDAIYAEDNRQVQYNLLVFKALALHNLERDPEAVEFYEKAAMLCPTISLAWQVPEGCRPFIMAVGPCELVRLGECPGG